MPRNTRSQTSPLAVPRAAPLIATTFALAAAACGESKSTARDTDAARHTPVVVEPNTPTAADSGRVAQTNVYYQDAQSAFDGKRYREAVELFAAYTQRKPKNPWGHYMLGLSAWKAGDLERAKGAFEEVLQLDPKHVKSLVNLSRVMLETGQPDEALTKITTALQIDSGSSDGYRILGRVQTALGHTDDALAAYRRAIAIDPKDAWSMNNMGLILIHQGCYEEALKPLARATQLESDVPVFQNNLGIALERTGHFSEATTAYQTALRADSSYSKASVNLARVQGRKDDPSVGSLDLSSLSEEFASEVKGWKDEGKAAATAETDSATVTATAPVISSGDSLAPPR
jgi:predicted Zn-dependent protease